MPTFDDLNGKTPASRVAVTAAGMVSPLGIGLNESLVALKANRDCILPVTSFDVTQCRCKTAGQVPDDWLNHRGNGRKDRRLHRASRMMIAALDELRDQDPEFTPELTVIGTTSGGMSFGQDYYRALHRHRWLRHSPQWIANYPPQ